METIFKLFIVTLAIPIFVSFNYPPEKKKLSFVSVFHNNGSAITIPFVEISDNNGSDNATNIAPGNTANLILLGNPTGIVEATVQIPANHPAGKVYLTRDDNPSTKIDCKTFSANRTNGITINLFDNNLSRYEYDIYYEEGTGLSCP